MSNPLDILLHLTKQYESACKKLDFIRAYEIAMDISDIALQLENLAQRLANEEM